MSEVALKNKYTERAKIFQQAMKSCKSSNPMDCIEWFADRIAELEEKLANADYQLEGRDNEISELKKSCDETQELLDKQIEATYKLDKENSKAKEIIKELYEGLDKLYLSGLSAKQIAFIEQLQDKAEQFLNSEVEE